MKEDLKNFVQKENLDEAVQFLGLLNREQVFSTLQQADCFVLSSKYETFGVVVIEAMLFGKPVIVSNCGGPESFVTQDTGIIVQNENDKDLSSAMIEVMMKRNFYDSAKIKKYVLSNFGTEIFTKRVNKIYHKAISTEINQEEGADCFHLERAITS